MTKDFKPGNKYRANWTAITPGGHVISKGDIFEVIEPTGHDPYGHGKALGRSFNWLIKGSYGVTVWAGIENAIADGFFELIG